jgi:hypothetical protein
MKLEYVYGHGKVQWHTIHLIFHSLPHIVEDTKPLDCYGKIASFLMARILAWKLRRRTGTSAS